MANRAGRFNDDHARMRRMSIPDLLEFAADELVEMAHGWDEERLAVGDERYATIAFEATITGLRDRAREERSRG